MVEMGRHIVSGDERWQAAKRKAFAQNSWFTPEFIDLATSNISKNYLEKYRLANWAKSYGIPDQHPHPALVGIVMAGNIPLVGFHDFLAVFLAGHKQMIKASSKDQALIMHLVETLHILDSGTSDLAGFAEMLKGCDAYIATGSNNSARCFEYYFGKYPHIIRQNRTSAAILDGSETERDLGDLADDVYQYFGLGCRNVTKIYVPSNYDFAPLLEAFSKYNYLSEQHKYKNNFDYQLAILILNKKYYMTNGSVLITEESSLYSPIGVLYFEYYDDQQAVYNHLRASSQVQCVVGKGYTGFGQSQQPGLTEYADGVDTMQFLLER